MDLTYLSLFAAYVTAILLWWLLFRYANQVSFYPKSWQVDNPFKFEAPLKEIGFALLGAVGVILVGQLWVADGMLPRENPYFDSVNQFLIFLPLLVVPLVRGHSAETMLLSTNDVITRFSIGLVFACFALFVFSMVNPDRIIF